MGPCIRRGAQGRFLSSHHILIFTNSSSQKQIDKDAKAEIDAAVEESKKSPFPDMVDFWTDIYYKGTEPPMMRGREREEVHRY